MRHQFAARQQAIVELPGSLEQVQQFFADPNHLVSALLVQDQVTRLDAERFAVRMQPIRAFNLQIRPVVELRIQTAGAKVTLTGIGCQLEGNAWLDQRFDLEFEGYLAPLRPFSSPGPTPPSLATLNQPVSTRLGGEANLQVFIEMPPFLRLTPPSVIQSVGTPIANGVLGAIRRSLSQKLPRQFQQWQRQQPQRPPAEVTSIPTH